MNTPESMTSPSPPSGQLKGYTLSWTSRGAVGGDTSPSALPPEKGFPPNLLLQSPSPQPPIHACSPSSAARIEIWIDEVLRACPPLPSSPDPRDSSPATTTTNTTTADTTTTTNTLAPGKAQGTWLFPPPEPSVSSGYPSVKKPIPQLMHTLKNLGRRLARGLTSARIKSPTKTWLRRGRSWDHHHHHHQYHNQEPDDGLPRTNMYAALQGTPSSNSREIEIPSITTTTGGDDGDDKAAAAVRAAKRSAQRLERARKLLGREQRQQMKQHAYEMQLQNCRAVTG